MGDPAIRPSVRRRLVRFFASAALAAAGSAAPAAALELASVPFRKPALLDIDPAAPPRFQLRGLPADAAPPFPGQEILFDVDITTAGPGDVRVADATSPGFAGFAERLANGADDFLFFAVPGEEVGVITSESFVLQEALGPGAVDLAGFVIEAIRLTFEGIEITEGEPPPPPLMFPSDSIVVTGTLTVTGAPVPEPGTGALLGLGLLLAASARSPRGRSR